MPERTIAIAADHAGVELKSKLKEYLEQDGIRVIDLGTEGSASVDYPDIANRLAAAVTGAEAQQGIVICGTGIGVSMAANRHAGVRAAVCHDITSARLARQHNDANVLALGARLIGSEVAKDCVATFIKTEFEGGRHAGRVKKLG
jgi:ribose 5-phosphate isomerase B